MFKAPMAALVLLLAPLLVTAEDRPSSAATPVRIPIDAELKTAEGRSVSGPTVVVISLYENKDSVESLWSEQQVITPDQKGNFTIAAGANSPEGIPVEFFTSRKARWIGIAMQGQPEQPRVMLVTVPYAARAGDAETFGGSPASDFIRSKDLKERVRSVLTEGFDVPQSGAGVLAQPLKTSRPHTHGGSIATAGNFQNLLTTGIMTGVWGSTLSNSAGSVSLGVTGVLGEVHGTLPGSYSAGVRGINYAVGGSGIGVVGYQDGSGWGVLGETVNGIGVIGRTTAAGITSAGVLAQYSGSGVGTALEIGNGAIKVSGANRAAFVHTVTAGNVLTDVGGNVATMIDNAVCNNDPNALLFVTLKLESTSHNTAVQVNYNESFNRWFIWRLGSPGTIPVGVKYNVLVIKQ